MIRDDEPVRSGSGVVSAGREMIYGGDGWWFSWRMWRMCVIKKIGLEVFAGVAHDV